VRGFGAKDDINERVSYNDGLRTAATLSVLIPLYNEEEFITILLERVQAAPLPDGLDREIIIVDDGSKDESVAQVEQFIASNPGSNIRLILHEKNRGKGAAIRTAIAAATGEFSVIQDADLEYDPAEFPKLLGPLLSGDADVVYGSRFMAAGERRVLYYWHSVANHVLTTLCNIVSDLNLTDMETCYKAFRTSFVKTIPIQSDRFGIEPELTVKFARRRARIYETPITYHGRTYDEGKKIGAKDAFEALWVILRSRFTTQIHSDAGHEFLDALSVAPKFNRWMADTIRPYTGKRLLEIGSGMGNLTRQLCSRRNIYFATDINPEYLEHLEKTFGHRPSVRVQKLDASHLPDFQPVQSMVDTVICLNVLEHIEDDAGTLQAIRTALQPEGKLILLVPNDPRAYGTLDKAIGHFRRYTPDGLAKLLAENGYEVEKILRFNRVSMPGWRFEGQVRKSTTLSPFGLRVFDKFVWLWRKIDSSLPWQPASIIAIARRPA
jgi:2-polyprenyl-3-methyl-5-hydroxy-6-metoxy-1,4-benzoquinol methylase